MADRKLTQEELLEAEAFFNLATMLGKSIQSAVYQMDHPDYNPEVMVWTESKEEEPEPAADEESDIDSAPESSQIETEPVIHSGEANIDNQLIQIALLVHDERLKELIGTSALYPMLRLAAEQFSLNPDDPASNLSPVDMKKAAIAWAIVKRVFAVRHPDETLRILNITDSIRGNVFYGSPPQAFRSMDKADEEMIVETCGLFVSDFDPSISMAQELDRISQLPPQNDRYIPLISKPFREQRAIAARRDFAPVPVGGGATIRARIGKAGEGPVELSEFEMLIQQVIGEMIQYRVRLDGEGSLPIRVTPEQIYRWMVNDISNTLHPSPETRSTIVTAVDKLIQTPAELHILEQLEKHTKLKSKPGYKKLIKNEGKIIGTLITGKHYGASYNGKALEDTFVIYDMPMFFYYSSFTGQLLKVDSKLITGATTKAGQPRNTYNDIILREHILYRVNLIKREKKDKNKNIVKQSRYEKKQPKLINNFTKTILLESLAEECEIALDTPKKLEVFRNKVLDYLRELKKQGEIKELEPKYESRRITGVSVTV